jgi:Heparinase II/III N-terminus/Heparinase II/III-like protein
LRLKKIIKAILSQSPRVTLQKILRLIHRQWQSGVIQKLDFFRPTYTGNFSRTAAPLGAFLKKPRLDSLIADREQILSLADLYLNHTFDLLGSGWVQVRHGMDCRGLENYRYAMGSAHNIDPLGSWLNRRVNASNKSYSKKIWRMIASDYIPIDWQLDFKSGYRWQEKKPASLCSPAPLPGVDIKIPWELSRMQHLPQLAWAYGLASQGVEGTQPAEAYSNEFRNQILDFIATNPPRFGVNWHCPMDVGIRVSNWLVAYDVFKAQGAAFDPEFEQVFKNSIYDHGLHIFQNLEWNPTLRSNHYLADITGLLFVSAYLPRSSETDSWLAFSVQELIRAMEEQFHPDGSNFEGSTCYHRLSAEMMLYGTALILGLPDNKREALKHYQPISLFPGLELQKAPIPFSPVPGSDQTSPLPPSHFEKLERIATFTRAALKPNGQAIQVGDNDSGRFLKLHPKFHKADSKEVHALYQNLHDYAVSEPEASYWIEDHLNHSHLIQAIDVLFGKQPDSPEPVDIEAQIVGELAGGKTVSASKAKNLGADTHKYTFGSNTSWDEGKQNLDALSPEQCHIYEIWSHGHSLKSGLKTICFPDFGLYLMVSPKMFLSIRCGPVGQNGNGGHAHNDALSIELQIDGIDHITDPGSYLYTPLPEIRNAYRSVKAHFAPHIDQQEPNPIDHNLFQMEDRAQAQCLYFGDKGFIGMHMAYGSPVYRLIQVEDDKLIIKDGIDGPEKLVPLDPLNPTNGLPFSSGYGIRLH